MGIRFLCALMTIVVLELVSCDLQVDEDSHICVRPFNVPKVISRSWKCGKFRDKICTKTEKRYVKEMRPSCCEGWMISAIERKCVPDCKRGCLRGTCVAPDTCVCDPPLVLINNITCEEPQCNPSCVNAKCVDDDKCICNEGFAALNITHCAPICPENFVSDPHNLECKPKCVNCINGICTAPNTCICDKGYIQENSTCVPYCNETCENGQCIAPNTCECNVGYSVDPLDKSQCHPICENSCVNAICVEPNECACLKGYERLSAWACKPKCDHCNNGECVAPNQCNCSDGYFKTDGINCTPVCSETCLNGYCSAPNRCTCNKGYELDEENTCQPVCKDECINATCASPDSCNCLPGFEKFNHSVCIPTCASCDNGVCLSPDNCQCNDGFNKTNGICEPVCSSPCINGYCESPKKCACNEGYFTDLIQSVCYKPCIGECANGKCNIDGECLCYSGYELFNNSCIEPEDCVKCNVACHEEKCQCPDGRPCYPTINLPVEAAQSTSLAGLQITWVLGGCVGILLVTVVIVIIGYIWKKRKEYGEKPTDNGNAYPSVLYTIPNTLIQNHYGDNRDDSLNDKDDEDTKEAVSLHLLEAGEDASEKIVL